MRQKFLMEQLAEYEGFCCIYLFIKSQRGKSSEVAARLGVSVGTINDYKKKIRAGECYCTFSADCKMRSI